MAELHFVSGPLEDQVVDLTGDLITIGRDSNNQIPIQNHTVSRHHAVLDREDDGHKSRDLRSGNVTRVNAVRFVHAKLKDVDPVNTPSADPMRNPTRPNQLLTRSGQKRHDTDITLRLTPTNRSEPEKDFSAEAAAALNLLNQEGKSND